MIFSLQSGQEVARLQLTYLGLSTLTSLFKTFPYYRLSKRVMTNFWDLATF